MCPPVGWVPEFLDCSLSFQGAPFPLVPRAPCTTPVLYHVPSIAYCLFAGLPALSYDVYPPPRGVPCSLDCSLPPRVALFSLVHHASRTMHHPRGVPCYPVRPWGSYWNMEFEVHTYHTIIRHASFFQVMSLDWHHSFRHSFSSIALSYIMYHAPCTMHHASPPCSAISTLSFRGVSMLSRAACTPPCGAVTNATGSSLGSHLLVSEFPRTMVSSVQNRH